MGLVGGQQLGMSLGFMGKEGNGEGLFFFLRFFLYFFSEFFFLNSFGFTRCYLFERVGGQGRGGWCKRNFKSFDLLVFTGQLRGF